MNSRQIHSRRPCFRLAGLAALSMAVAIAVAAAVAAATSLPAAEIASAPLSSAPLSSAPLSSEPLASEPRGSSEQPGRIVPPVVVEPPELLTPIRPREEADCDRVEALALFSAACVKQQREQWTAALRLYQRAHRYDPESAAILRGVVATSAHLGRSDVTWRYAVKLVRCDGTDPDLQRSVAVQLSKTGQWKEAMAIYEKVASGNPSTRLTVADLLVWIDMGRLYCLAEQFDKAAARFAALLDAVDHPDRFGLEAGVLQTMPGKWPETFSLFGEAFLAAGRYDEAAEMFRRACPAADQKPLLEFHLAVVDAKRGKHQSALDRLERCFSAKLTGRDAVPYRVLVDAMTALGRQGEAIAKLESLHAANPADVALAYFLADAYCKALRFDKAEPLLAASLRRSPSLIGYRDLIDVYRKTRRYEPLLRTLGEAFAKIGFLEPLSEKSRSLASDAELLRELLKTARAVLPEKPRADDFDACMALAELASHAKQFEASSEFFERALRARPLEAKTVLPRFAIALLAGNQFPQAAAILQRAIDQKVRGDDDPSLYFSLAMALERSGKVDESVQVARRGLALATAAKAPGATSAKQDSAAKTPAAASAKPGAKPGSAASKDDDDDDDAAVDPHAVLAGHQSRLAWVLYRAKRYDEAAQVCAELLRKHDAEYGSAVLREALQEVRLILSNVAVARNDSVTAQRWLEEVLDEFPDDPAAMNDLGYLLADAGNHLAMAHRMIRKAVGDAPDNAAYRDSLGWVLFRMKRFDEAIVELENAAQKEPDATVLEHLGDAYAAQGNAPKAGEAYRRAAEAYVKSREPEKAESVRKKIRRAP